MDRVELERELAKVRQELKKTQEELLHEMAKRARLEGEIEGFQKCFKMVNEMPDPSELPDDGELN